MNVCKGFSKDESNRKEDIRKPCKIKGPLDINGFCFKYHEYIIDFPDLINLDYCWRHHKYKYIGKKCVICQKESNKRKKEPKIQKNLSNKCKVDLHFHRKKNTNGLQNIKQDGVCKRHLHILDELKKYNFKIVDEILPFLVQCTKCEKVHHKDNNEFCKKLTTKFQEGRTITKERKAKKEKPNPPCEAITQYKKRCIHPYTKTLDGVNYCTEHYNKEIKRQELAKQGLKPCPSHYGCKNTVPIDSNIICDKCNELANISAKERLQKRKIYNLQQIANKDYTLICLKCGDEFEMFKTKQFKEAMRCLYCFNKQREYEKRRPLRKRKETEARKKWKKEWKIKNYDKVVRYWINYRLRQIEKLGLNEYRRLNAETMAKWRMNNPIKHKKIYERAKQSTKIKLSSLKREANKKNIQWNLTDEESYELICNECHYCGFIDNINSIDRVDSKQDYNKDNCVSCCKLCNYMKNTIDYRTFIEKAEHIAVFNNLIDGQLYQDAFFDYSGKNISYSIYKCRAKNKNINFEITKEQFNEIIINDCYLCGKKITDTHQNGIDRVDSKIGYIEENLKACCGGCNYFKREFNLEDILNKCKLITEHVRENKLYETKFYTCILERRITEDSDEIITTTEDSFDIICNGTEEYIDEDIFDNEDKSEDDNTDELDEQNVEDETGELGQDTQIFKKKIPKTKSLQVKESKETKKLLFGEDNYKIYISNIDSIYYYKTKLNNITDTNRLKKVNKLIEQMELENSEIKKFKKEYKRQTADIQQMKQRQKSVSLTKRTCDEVKKQNAERSAKSKQNQKLIYGDKKFKEINCLRSAISKLKKKIYKENDINKKKEYEEIIKIKNAELEIILNT